MAQETSMMSLGPLFHSPFLLSFRFPSPPSFRFPPPPIVHPTIHPASKWLAGEGQVAFRHRRQ
jgi:hypothetical protein